MLRKKHFTQLIGENYSRYERSNFWRTLWVFTVSRTSKGGRGGGTNCADIPDSRDKVGVTLKALPSSQATLRTISGDRRVYYEEVAVYVASSGSR